MAAAREEIHAEIASKDQDTRKKVVLETVQWASVSRIEEMGQIGDNDFAVLDELRQVILRHGYENRFGVCLLHKHFDLQPGEAALEETDESLRVSTIRIVAKAECEGAMETAWRFSPGDGISAGRNCTNECKGFGISGHTKNHKCIPT